MDQRRLTLSTPGLISLVPKSEIPQKPTLKLTYCKDISIIPSALCNINETGTMQI